MGALMFRREYCKVRELMQAVREDWLLAPRPNLYAMAVEAMLRLDATGEEALVLLRDAARFDVDLPVKVRLAVAEALLAANIRSRGDPEVGAAGADAEGGAGEVSSVAMEGDVAEEQASEGLSNADSEGGSPGTCPSRMAGRNASLLDRKLAQVLPRYEHITSEGIRRRMCFAWQKLLTGEENWAQDFRQSWKNRRLRNWAVQAPLPEAFFAAAGEEFRTECMQALGAVVVPAKSG
eukprot:g1686.t1